MNPDFVYEFYITAYTYFGESIPTDSICLVGVQVIHRYPDHFSCHISWLEVGNRFSIAKREINDFKLVEVLIDGVGLEINKSLFYKPQSPGRQIEFRYR